MAASSGTAHRSARVPSPGRIPAVVATKTRVPVARVPERSTTPTPWVPGTYGVAGRPKYDVPEAQSWSSGTIGAAVTATTVLPTGCGCSPYRGGSPGVCRTAARTDQPSVEGST